MWLSWLLIVIFSLTILVLIILLALGIFKPFIIPGSNPEQALNELSAQQGWNPIEGTPVSNERGTCLLYNTFSIETLIVDNLEPLGEFSKLPPEFTCDDGFTQALVKKSRTCAQEECLGYDGKTYSQGQVEEFYTYCGDRTICSNGRSAIVFDIRPPEGLCLQTDFTVVKCPPGLPDQVFLNVDQNANSVRIRVPGTVDCLTYQENNLILKPCLDSPNQGFDWFYVPQYSGSTFYYPDQISTIDGKMSLQVSGNQIQLKNFATCLYNEPCPQKTVIISAYSYLDIF